MAVAVAGVAEAENSRVSPICMVKRPGAEAAAAAAPAKGFRRRRTKSTPSRRRPPFPSPSAPPSHRRLRQALAAGALGPQHI